MTIIKQIKAEELKISEAKKRIVRIQLASVNIDASYRRALQAAEVSNHYVEAISSIREIVDKRVVVYNIMVRKLYVHKGKAISLFRLGSCMGNYYYKRHDILYDSDAKYTELYDKALLNLK